MCGPEMCTPPLINSYEPHILSFGEDEGGMQKNYQPMYCIYTT